MKKLKLWIYEYKDDDTPIGATIIDEFIDKIETSTSFTLPHLHPDWHYKYEIYFEEDD